MIVELGARQQHQPSHRLYGWKPGELDGRQHLSHRLRDGEPGEVEGAQIYELAEPSKTSLTHGGKTTPGAVHAGIPSHDI